MENKTALVISDIHGNRPALEAVFDDATYDIILCAGDLIGILGFNEWVVDTVVHRSFDCVFGNHDARVRPDFAYTPSFPAAQDEMRIVTEQLRDDQLKLLSKLLVRSETHQYMMGHSRPLFQRDPGYPCHGFAADDRGLRPRDFTQIGPHIDGKIAIMGHTHEQHAVDVGKFPGQEGLVLNPGSVGVPYYESADYALVDLETQDYELRSAEYDASRVEDRFDEIGLEPGQYGNRLERSKR